MDRSAWGVRLSASVKELLAGLGSVVPAGGVTVAVLVNEPIAPASIVGVKLKVTLALTGRFTMAARAPVPLVGPETLPPPVLPVSVQTAPVTPAGNASKTLAPVTALRPELLTVMT